MSDGCQGLSIIRILPGIIEWVRALFADASEVTRKNISYLLPVQVVSLVWVYHVLCTRYSINISSTNIGAEIRTVSCSYLCVNAPYIFPLRELYHTATAAAEEEIVFKVFWTAVWCALYLCLVRINEKNVKHNNNIMIKYFYTRVIRYATPSHSYVLPWLLVCCAVAG